MSPSLHRTAPGGVLTPAPAKWRTAQGTLELLHASELSDALQLSCILRNQKQVHFHFLGTSSYSVLFV